MKHASNCLCLQCKAERHQQGAALLADKYETKTQVLTAESVYYNGSAWIVNYKLKSKDARYPGGSSSHWMYVGQWNTNVRKWNKEQPNAVGEER